MHTFPAILFAVFLLAPCYGQLFDGLRLRNPLSNLFGQRGGDPDSDVSDGRTEPKDDPLPDMIPRTDSGHGLLYRSRPSVVIQPAFVDPGYFYFPRPGPYTLGGVPPRPPPAASGHVPLVQPPVAPAPAADSSRLLYGDAHEEDRLQPSAHHFARRPGGNTRSIDNPSGEDRIIEALKLFKQLRTMAM